MLRFADHRPPSGLAAAEEAKRCCRTRPIDAYLDDELFIAPCGPVRPPAGPPSSHRALLRCYTSSTERPRLRDPLREVSDSMGGAVLPHGRTVQCRIRHLVSWSRAALHDRELNAALVVQLADYKCCASQARIDPPWSRPTSTSRPTPTALARRRKWGLVRRARPRRGAAYVVPGGAALRGCGSALPKPGRRTGGNG